MRQESEGLRPVFKRLTRDEENEESVNEMQAEFLSMVVNAGEKRAPGVVVDPATLCFFDSTLRTAKDVEELERAIARVMGGENGRCGYLLSAAYQRLKMDALYGNLGREHRVLLGNVRVTMDRAKRAQAFCE